MFCRGRLLLRRKEKKRSRVGPVLNRELVIDWDMVVHRELVVEEHGGQCQGSQ
jgi:hypothetical protein